MGRYDQSRLLEILRQWLEFSFVEQVQFITPSHAAMTVWIDAQMAGYFPSYALALNRKAAIRIQLLDFL